jgi:hypothetical protein
MKRRIRRRGTRRRKEMNKRRWRMAIRRKMRR